MTLIAERFEDMSPRGRLQVLQQNDGDMIVAIVPDPDARPMCGALSVEFCTSGGKSPKTREALRALMLAMAEENAADPSAHRRGEHGLGVTEPVPARGGEDALDAGSFQARVADWTQHCFGVSGLDPAERSHRFVEEALEMAQAAGVSADEVRQLTDYVYGRPVGALAAEAGGTLLTLAALCQALGLQMHLCGERELERVHQLRDRIRAKHLSRPKNSPLPGAASC